MEVQKPMKGRKRKKKDEEGMKRTKRKKEREEGKKEGKKEGADGQRHRRKGQRSQQLQSRRGEMETDSPVSGMFIRVSRVPTIRFGDGFVFETDQS